MAQLVAVIQNRHTGLVDFSTEVQVVLTASYPPTSGSNLRRQCCPPQCPAEIGQDAMKLITAHA
jgi:hypothetical protein